VPVGFRILYRLGITPWDHETPLQVKAVAGGAATSRGHALDVGCGTGRDAVFLAEHGWTVTGIDAVPRALDTARRRSTAAGVEVRWVVGDVTRLPELETGDGHDLVLDLGCFHGLSDHGRALGATGITSVAAPGALLLMMAFPPGRRGPLPRGISHPVIASSRAVRAGHSLRNTADAADHRLMRT
jgi:SAM-dependent methyltransferase